MVEEANTEEEKIRLQGKSGYTHPAQFVRGKNQTPLPTEAKQREPPKIDSGNAWMLEL